MIAVRAADSVGIARYCERLAAALADAGWEYAPASHAGGTGPAHFHLGNSSRSALRQALLHRGPTALTVHDVRARTAVVRPFQRLMVAHCVRRAGAIIVHSEHAAEMLSADTGLPLSRIDVIPHAAPRSSVDRETARRTLGWGPGAPVAVVPGVIKRVKAVHEILTAISPLLHERRWRLVLAGTPKDAEAVRRARTAGADVLASPDAASYEHAIAAADVVMVLRHGSVGETNGPLLDALGAGRAILATRTGSIPEVAGPAARYTDVSADGIRAALTALADPCERRERERLARERARGLSWASAARAHVDVFRRLLQ